jgi:hypothetical protein
MRRLSGVGLRPVPLFPWLFPEAAGGRFAFLPEVVR